MDLEDYDAAIADFTSAAALDEGGLSGRRALSNAWVTKGDYDRALEQWDDLTALDPFLRPYGLSERARVLCRVGRLEEAQRALTEIIAAEPHVSNAYLLLAWVHVRQDQHDEARDALNLLIEQDSRGPFAEDAREALELLDMGQAKQWELP